MNPQAASHALNHYASANPLMETDQLFTAFVAEMYLMADKLGVNMPFCLEEARRMAIREQKEKKN